MSNFNLVVLILIYIVGFIDLILLYKYLTARPSKKNRTFKEGEKLEFDIYQELKRVPGNNKVLKNLYLPRVKGGTTEVDILFIHQSGVYAFESKDYSGWIYGKEKDFKWTQVFNKNSKFQFYNPIKQNNTHLKAIKQVLAAFNNISYHSVIVFGSNAELKKVEYDENNVTILNFNKKLPDFIKSSQLRLSEQEINQIYNILKNYANVSDSIKEQHIKQVNAEVHKAS